MVWGHLFCGKNSPLVLYSVFAFCVRTYGFVIHRLDGKLSSLSVCLTGNGSFAFSHFLNLMANRFGRAELEAKQKHKTEEEEAIEKEMKEAFKVFDADGNGFISQGNCLMQLPLR